MSCEIDCTLHKHVETNTGGGKSYSSKEFHCTLLRTHIIHKSTCVEMFVAKSNCDQKIWLNVYPILFLCMHSLLLELSCHML